MDGVPSPNPDIPQDIHVVTGNNTINVGSTQYPLNLGSLELCKIEDYQDYLYKENGNWYKHNAIEKLILDGSESWGLNTTNNPYYSLSSVYYSMYALFFRGYCSHFQKKSAITASDTNIGIFASKDNHYIRIRLSTMLPIEDFKTWLSNNNVKLLYIADTPTTAQITDTTLISQLNAIDEHLQLQKEINNITVTPGDIVPYMKLTYMQDLPSKLNAIESRISALEE